jgi:hypothetical protein
MARQAFTRVQAQPLNGGIVYLYRATRAVEPTPAGVQISNTTINAR